MIGNKQTIVFIDQECHLTEMETFERTPGDGIPDGSGIPNFKIISLKTDDKNIATLDLEFTVTHYAYPDKIFRLGMTSLMCFNDPDRELEKSLYSQMSMGLITGVFKTNIESLMQAYIQITEFEARFDPKAGLKTELSWDRAIELTGQIMERKKNEN